MKTKTILTALSVVATLIYSCNADPGSTTSTKTNTTTTTNNGGFTSKEEWGKHIVAISGCSDCHTPKKMTDHGPVDNEALLFAGALASMPPPELIPAQTNKGVAATFDETSWIGPWGKSFAANISSDSTGIGMWKEVQFINCLKKGFYKGIEGSRTLMPPMPWQDYSKMSDDEISAIFAYLKATKPVHNIVAEYQPPVDAHK